MTIRYWSLRGDSSKITPSTSHFAQKKGESHLPCISRTLEAGDASFLRGQEEQKQAAPCASRQPYPNS